MDPSGGTVGCSGESRRFDESFDQDGVDCVLAAPVLGQAAADDGEDMGCQVRDAGPWYQRFTWLTRHAARQSTETRTVSFHVPRHREAIAHADMLSGEEALPEARSRHVERWLAYHEQAARLCDRIRQWPERADALLGEWTGPDRDLRPMRNWRARAEPLLAEVSACRWREAPMRPTYSPGRARPRPPEGWTRACGGRCTGSNRSAGTGRN